MKNIITILILLPLGLKAQKITTNQNLYWLRYYNQLTLNDKWVWHNEIEDRRFMERNRQHHLIIHSRMHYKIRQNLDVALGLTYSLQDPQDPNSSSELTVPEIRPVQEINYTIPVSKRLAIQQRLRIDERFIHKNNGQELTDGYDFNVRFRYRLQANLRLDKENIKHPVTLKVSNEIMFNAGSNIVYNQFDQNRVYGGIERVFNKNLSAELGYLHWYQQRPLNNQFFERNIIRLTLYHRLKLHKE
jgi:hypothetical protein